MTKKKSSLTDEERKIVHEMKDELSRMGVPREEWSSYIQRELIERKKERKKSSGKRSFFSRIWNKIKQKIGSVFQKFMMKRMNINEDSLEGLMDGAYDDMSDEDREMMNMMFGGGMSDSEIEELGKQGTFVAEREDKKRMIVDFEDDD